MTKLEMSQQLEVAMQATTSTCLISKNIRINDRRTSVRLEPEMWDALIEIAEIEDCTIHDLCTAVSDCKNDDSSFTASLRVFLMAYYRSSVFVDSRIHFVRQRILSLK